MKKLLVILCVAVLVFTSCGAGEKSAEKVSVVKPSDILTDESSTVWLLTDNASGDGVVEEALIFNGEDCYIYPMKSVLFGDHRNGHHIQAENQVTIKDFAKLEDNEAAIEFVKQTYEDLMNTVYDKIPSVLDMWSRSADMWGTDEDISKKVAAAQTTKENFLTELEKFKQNDFFLNYTPDVNLVTDSTGNAAKEEWIPDYVDWRIECGSAYQMYTYERGVAESFPVELKFGGNLYYTAFNTPIYPFEVYDKYFGGFCNMEGGSCLVRVCNEDTVFELDTPDFKHDRFTVDDDSAGFFVHNIELYTEE